MVKKEVNMQYELCPHINRCGHALNDISACNADVYCSYRRLRFHDGPEMPIELKQEIDKVIKEGGETDE